MTLRDIMAFLVLEVLSGLEIDGVSQILTPVSYTHLDRKGGIQTTQEVEIYVNFVGRFVPPAVGEAELTPEELEEIRKREEMCIRDSF